MSAEPLGYIVVEFNQASGQPLSDGFIFDDRDEAEEELAQQHTLAVARGRKERFAIGTVTIEDDE